MRPSRIGAAALLASTALFATALPGCVLVFSGPPLQEKTADLAPAHVTGKPLEVQAHNGSVHVAAGSSLAIHATLRMESDQRLGDTTISADRQGDGTLLIRATPPSDGWHSNEGCSFEVTLPDAQGVTVVTDNGRIELEGLAGKADLRTSNGSVVAKGQGGPVTATTSNGRVEVLNARGPVAATTSNGSIRVALASDAGGPVSARTSNGSIEIALSQAFHGSLELATTHGSVHVPEGDGVSVSRNGKTSATLRVGEGGSTSDAHTSNGSITVTRP